MITRDFQSPLLSAGPQFSGPVFGLSFVGDQASIFHHPVACESKLNPWMWKMQTCGSFFLIGSASPGSSWIFTVPLNPFGSILLPPVAAAGLDAVKTNRAKPTSKVMTPLALRIRFLASCGFDSPVHGAFVALRRRQGRLHERARA